jgi:hypothetical protein
MGNPSRRSRRRIRARVGDPHGEGGSGSRWQGGRTRQREIGREKGHSALLTTPGCCDDGWKSKIEGAGIESRWRRVVWRRRCPQVERRHGSARAQREAEGGSGG